MLLLEKRVQVSDFKCEIGRGDKGDGEGYLSVEELTGGLNVVDVVYF